MASAEEIEAMLENGGAVPPPPPPPDPRKDRPPTREIEDHRGHRDRRDDRGRDRRDDRDRGRNRAGLSKSRERSPSPDPAIREAEEAMRDDLTVLVQRIHPRADDFEIFEFFSQAGKASGGARGILNAVLPAASHPSLPAQLPTPIRVPPICSRPPPRVLICGLCRCATFG